MREIKASRRRPLLDHFLVSRHNFTENIPLILALGPNHVTQKGQMNILIGYSTPDT